MSTDTGKKLVAMSILGRGIVCQDYSSDGNDTENGSEGDRPKPGKRQGEDLDHTVAAKMENRGQIPESFGL